ncbi:MAG: aldo/keto reductase [Chitinispirillales bacterium]|jgi:predicted aldo/keto reductase-like oxidoreductase|nr:aldo/keto reductase [Chitinispirillales bacterium]
MDHTLNNMPGDACDGAQWPCGGMNRRGFIKMLGAGAAGAAAAALGGCGQGGAGSPRTREVPMGKMTYRTDPMNGNKLSLLGYGMMRLPRVARMRGESLPDVNDIDQEAVNELVDYAIAHGVNVFDTAPVYCKGFSEKSTGEALSRHPRDKYFVATKMSNMRPPARSREASIQIYNKSFEDLQVDYIDYYFIHNVGSPANFKERFLDNGILEFLMKEKEAGRIRNLGWSFHGDGEFFEYLMSDKYKWDFVMIQLNYLDWGNVVGQRTNVNAQRQYEIATKSNTPIWIMEPVLGGGLAMPHYKALERMTQADPEASAASWGFRFAGSFPNVATVLSGMTFMDHLQDNICTYSPLVPLTDSEREMLLGDVMEVMLEHRNIVCTRCQYCMPCPYGVDIPEVFTHYNRSMNEGNYPDNRKNLDFRRARRAFLVGMDRNVSPMRQANRCISCGLCVATCPQRINIPEQMVRIDKFVESLRV